MVEKLSQAEAALLKRMMAALGGACIIEESPEKGDKPSSVRALLVGGESQFARLGADIREAELPISPLGSDIITAVENYRYTPDAVSSGTSTWDLRHRTRIMGVLNVTPDSFSDGGRYFSTEKAIQHGIEMMKQGADLVDVGGESTRPGSEPVSETKELRRVLPVVEALASEGVPVSIDTCKSPVAKRAIEAGAVMINDISGLRFDPGIAEIAAEYETPLILMHIKGTPRDMQKDTHYEDLMGEIIDHLHASEQTALKAGVKPEKIIIDPGIGFGKSFTQNLEILRRLRELKILGHPILVGPSRKAFIGAILGKTIDGRLFGTCAACALAAANGADILRVHDTDQISQTIKTVDCITGKLSFDEAVKTVA